MTKTLPFSQNLKLILLLAGISLGRLLGVGDFLLLHHNYCAMVSEEQYDAHRTVSGLKFEQYLAKVNDTYDKAEKSFVIHPLNGLCMKKGPVHFNTIYIYQSF